MSRNEDILQAIINGESLEDYRPQSRMEALLLQLGGAPVVSYTTKEYNEYFLGSVVKFKISM